MSTTTTEVDRPTQQHRRHPRDSQIVPAVLDRVDGAAYVGVSLSKLAELTATNDIPSFKVGRKRLYRRVDLDAWVEAKMGGAA